MTPERTLLQPFSALPYHSSLGFASGPRGHSMLFPTRFDVIVVGGGHAGTEAALVSARMGRSTLVMVATVVVVEMFNAGLA